MNGPDDRPDESPAMGPDQPRSRTRRVTPRQVIVGATLVVQALLFIIAALYVRWEVRTILPATSAKLVMDRLMGAELVAFSASIGLITVVSTVIFRRYDTALERINATLEQEVNDRLAQTLKTRHSLILGLAKLADYRDTDTGRHLDRISTFSCMIAEHVRHDYPEIDDDWIECLRLASSLHDIGKVGIPDRILLKAGSLTQDERAIIERHAQIGADTLAAIRDRLGPDPLIDMSHEIAMGHHERWDGRGYPKSVGEDEIPLAARIVSLADVYDALTSARVYKQAFPHEKARRIILEGAGTQFDPHIVAAFDELNEQFDIVRRALHTGDSESSASAAA